MPIVRINSNWKTTSTTSCILVRGVKTRFLKKILAYRVSEKNGIVDYFGVHHPGEKAPLKFLG